MPSTVKKIPFKSLEVIWLRTVTLGTFGLGGAAVDATHDGGFDFFFGGIAVCLWLCTIQVLTGTQEPSRNPRLP